MSTAAGVMIENLKHISRERRAHQETLDDAREALRNQQQSLLSLSQQLLETDSDEIERQVSSARAQLKTLAAAVAAAADDLTEFEKHNPTDDQIRAKEKAAIEQARNETRAKLIADFTGNVRRRLELMDELRQLETAAGRIADEVSPLGGGVPAELVSFLPQNFWGCPAGVVLHPAFAAALRPWSRHKAVEWLRANGVEPSEQ